VLLSRSKPNPNANPNPKPNPNANAFPNSNPNHSIWAVDSGASHHMCNDPYLFTSLSQANYIVHLGDHNQVKVNQAGIVRINDFSLYCLLVPDFRICLISVSQLDSTGYKSTFFQGNCSILDPDGRKVIEAREEGGLYKVRSAAKALISTRSGLQTKLPDKGKEKHVIRPPENGASFRYDQTLTLPVRNEHRLEHETSTDLSTKRAQTQYETSTDSSTNEHQIPRAK
jgi:hypothetical protein